MINNQFMSTNMDIKKVVDKNGNPAYLNRSDKLDAKDIYVNEDQTIGTKTIKSGSNLLDTLKEITVSGNQTDLINTITDLQSRLAIAEAKISDLKQTNVEAVTVDSGSSISATDATKDYVISGEITTASKITSKSTTLDSITVNNSTVKNLIDVKANDELVIKNSNIDTDVSVSSNVIRLIDGKYLTIKDTTFSGTTFNTIMTGQKSTSYIKGCTIENCNFNETCKHINIWFAGFQDNAVLNISNCHFKSMEQFLCLSDYSGVTNHLTVNISNCVIDNYQKDGSEYEGFILCDDRFCTTEEAFLAAKPFSNITININNLTAGGVKVTSDNFIMGNPGYNQMLYVFCAASIKTYKFSEHPELFPIVNIA